MKAKSRPHAWIHNALWMVLLVLCAGLVLRGFGAWVDMIEAGHGPADPGDFRELLSILAAYLVENWQSEVFPFVGQVLGLACLLQFAPLPADPIKRSQPADDPSVSLERAGAGGTEIIS